MNADQIRYIRENHERYSVRQLAKVLKADRKEVRRTIKKFGAVLSRDAAEGLTSLFKGRRVWLHGAAVIILLTTVSFLYAGTLSFPFTNWDDPRYVVENSDIKKLTYENLHRFFTQAYVEVYAPLTMLSFAVDYQIYGLNAFGFHITNVVLHALSTCLISYI